MARDKQKQKKAQHAWYVRNKANPEWVKNRYKKKAEWKHGKRLTPEEIVRRREERTKESRERRLAVRRLIESVRLSGCSKCPENDPCCLDFHHVNPREKSFSIGVALSRNYKMELVKAELEKCIVLCRNCHAKAHNGKR